MRFDPLSSRTTRVVAGLASLVVVSFAIHYVLFGSLPIGTPELLRDDSA